MFRSGFRDRVVLVTGASSGIGRAAARTFAREGARVVAVARREELLQSLVDECRGDAPDSGYLAGDLSERSFAESIVAETVAQHGRIDVLVNNAAITKHKHTLRLDPSECAQTLSTNFLSCVWTTLAALPHMLEQKGGAIVNVSSFAAVAVPPREGIYAASKAAMNAFTEGLWHDLAGSGIHAAVVTPGPIDTEIWQKGDEPMAYRGRLYPAQSVADAILEVIRAERHEVTIPKRNLALGAARLLRLVWPSMLRRGMQRMDPNPPDLSAISRRVSDGQGVGGGGPT